jgi:hypothetical protein
MIGKNADFTYLFCLCYNNFVNKLFFFFAFLAAPEITVFNLTGDDRLELFISEKGELSFQYEKKHCLIGGDAIGIAINQCYILYGVDEKKYINTFTCQYVPTEARLNVIKTLKTIDLKKKADGCNWIERYCFSLTSCFMKFDDSYSYAKPKASKKMSFAVAIELQELSSDAAPKSTIEASRQCRLSLMRRIWMRFCVCIKKIFCCCNSRAL